MPVVRRDVTSLSKTGSAKLKGDVTLSEGSNVTITQSGNDISIAASGGSGSGDVVGPASATDEAIARFDTTTGELLQNSSVTLDDSGSLGFPEAGGFLFSNNQSTSNGNGGNFQIDAGNGNGTGTGGAYFLNAGDGGSTGSGGYMEINGGDAGISGDGEGGTVEFNGGNGRGTGNGGNLVFSSGRALGSGTDGKIYFQNGSAGIAEIDATDITTTKTFTLPDTSGTVALTSNINNIDETQLDASVNASLDLADSAVQDLSDLSITATASELNVLDGITASTAELNYTDGVTSAIQTQIDGKAATSHTHTAAQITDFDTEVSNNTDVAANTAARHAALTVTDSSEIDLALTGQDLTASLKAASIDESKLDASVNASLDLADSAVQDLADLSITATASELNVLDGITSTTAELNYTDGVTSAIQTQLNNKQPLDSDLTTIAGLTATTDNVIQSVGSAWASRTPAQLKTTLALAKADVGLGNVDNTSDATKANSIWPIGTVYTNKTNSANPSTYLLGASGQTWTAITDVFIVARGSTYTGTGGAATHTHPLSSAGGVPIMLDADETQILRDGPTVSVAAGNRQTGVTWAGGSTTITTSMGLRGATDAGSTIPPYQAVYAWERTA